MRALHLVAACALTLLAASPASAQQEDPNFVAEPGPGSQTAPRGGYFLLDAEPGEEITQSVGVRNDSGQTLELRLAAVDAVTGQLGGASYAIEDEPPSRTGAWIALEQPTVTLEPDASAIVAFRVGVPLDAESGQHLAGISIRTPSAATERTEAGEGQAGASIDVQTRRIIAVQVNVPGPSEAELVIDGVEATARPDGLYVEIAIRNPGQELTKAGGQIQIGEDFEHDFAVDTFVPRTAIAYPIKWTTETREGEYSASVELRYGDEIAQWQGTFTVGEVVLDELADRRVNAVPGDDDEGVLPVAPIAGAAVAGAVVVVTGALALSRFRRPRGKHAIRRRRS
jgi:hypothetical protein